MDVFDMPTIEVSHKDLCRLIGKKIPVKELQSELILYAKGEVDAADGDTLKIDIKDTNRPDLWSAEGIAREIRSRITNDKGVPKYKVQKSGFTVKVSTKSDVQPLAACAVAEGLDIDDAFLSQIIQLQEKISSSFGRKRRELSMGIYDMKTLEMPVTYASMKPQDIKFVPLGFSKAMTAKEILSEHPKGKEYGHLLEGAKEYPVWLNGKGRIMAMPPVINSEELGNISTKTRDVFIEVTGYSMKFLAVAINVLAAQMLERKAGVKSVRTAYPKGSVVTPDFAPKNIEVSADYIRKLTGLGAGDNEIIELLKKSRYAVLKGNAVSYPSYRQDIMHKCDVAEDVAISYGYNKIEPRIPELPTRGKLLGKELFSESIAEIMAGAGFHEILSYTLTNKSNLFLKMKLGEEQSAEIENPASSNWGVFRTWLLPGLLEFLSQNKHVDYPQAIFEIGDAILLDEKAETKTRDSRKIAAAISDAAINYDRISSAIDALLRNLGIKFRLQRTHHPSFISGRAAEVVTGTKSIGIAGEIAPEVLNNWALEKPVVAFELDLDKIFDMLKK